MTRLVWGELSQRKYEAGVDRGVLYPEGAAGVVWNGLVSVQEATVGGEIKSLYFDGIKFLDLVSSKNFQATISAFSAPEAFSRCVGDKSVVPGFVLTRQPREQFGLSYRTLIGDGDHYKIHLVYNASASPVGRNYASIAPSTLAEALSWVIDTVPPVGEGFRPASHFIFDTTEMEASDLATLEAILYGSDTTAPRLPTLEDLFDLLVAWGTLLIVPDTITGLAHLVPGEGDIYTTRHPGIHRALPVTRLVETVISGLYELE